MQQIDHLITGAVLDSAERSLASMDTSRTPENVFRNLAFTICAPQTNYKANRQAQENLMALRPLEMDRTTFEANEAGLRKVQEALRPTRFWQVKGRRVYYAISALPHVMKILNWLDDGMQSKYARAELLDFIPGLGPKAASHFLRNMGVHNLAILDVHILRFLGRKKAPATLAQYEALERRFNAEAARRDISPAMLDAVLWIIGSGVKEFNQ